jgi:putative hydrolase of the HAD superfamily
MHEVHEELFEAIFERFSQPDAWLIYEDVIPTVQTLEQMGLKLAVVSNWDERLVGLLDRLGLAPYFDEIVVSAAVGAHKPDRRIFEQAIRLLDVSPGETLHIGDSAREDLAGARASGLNAVRVRRSGAEEKDDIGSLRAIAGLLGKTISPHVANQLS